MQSMGSLSKQNTGTCAGEQLYTKNSLPPSSVAPTLNFNVSPISFDWMAFHSCARGFTQHERARMVNNSPIDGKVTSPSLSNPLLMWSIRVFWSAMHCFSGKTHFVHLERSHSHDNLMSLWLSTILRRKGSGKGHCVTSFMLHANISNNKWMYIIVLSATSAALWDSSFF